MPYETVEYEGTVTLKHVDEKAHDAPARTVDAGTVLRERAMKAHPAAAEKAPPKPEKPYDPEDYHVDEVIAHVGDDADLAASVLASERGGLNRSTLIRALEHIVMPAPADVT